MKKRIFAALLAAAMIVSLCACGNGDENPSGTNKPVTPPSVTTLESFDDFKTIMKDDYAVTDEKVEEYFFQMLCAQGAGLIEVKDRDTVQKGDVLQLDYKGILDGKAFENGSAENQIIDVDGNCTLDEGTGQMGNSFIDKFTDGLVGAKKNTFMDKTPTKHNVKFPEKYSQATLAGKEVTFEFIIDRIYIKATPDNVTDEYVAKYMSKQGFTTVKAFLQDCKEQLVASAIINYTIAKSKTEIPTDYLNQRLAEYEAALVEASGANSIDEYVTYYYQSKVNTVRPYWLSSIKSRVITEVVLAEMVKSKNITVSEEKLNEYVAEVLAVNSSFTEAEDIYFEFGYGNIEAGKTCLMNQLAVQDYIIEKYNASQAVTE